VEDLQLVEPRPDRLGALQVEDGGEPVAVEVGRRPRDPQRALRRPFEPQQERGLGERLAALAWGNWRRVLGAAW
jgi:hypothetical protein